jgi:3-hydroxybutyryl-CoA dehydrogenase
MTAVGVVGAGVMGAGIAQVAASHGCEVTLIDVSQDMVRKALGAIAGSLERLVDKGKVPPSERDLVLNRLHVGAGPDALADCELIIEAVAESREVKAKVFQSIKPHANKKTIFASNTSSLSISQLARGAELGPQLVGMHFFNPVPLMPLVEVIAGDESDPQATNHVADFARAWGKTPVRVKDTPGFIVNRVARGYYLESLRILGEGHGGITEIDRTMRDLGGFRMGPFELMDLVGIDVNYSVSESVWQQLGQPARLKPHPIQAQLFKQGRLGRKTKTGFYSYDQEPAVPAVTAEQAQPTSPAPATAQVVATFSASAVQKSGTPCQAYIFARVLVTIINEAALVLGEGVANRSDIDIAMRLGTNYPKGPLEWAGTIGIDRCHRLLLELNAEAEDNRFAPAPLIAAGSFSH